MLRKNPGFTVVAVLTLALGIGANTAVFSVVNAVLLKPLSYRDPDRIVTLSGSSTTGEAPLAAPKQISIPDFQDWHDQSPSFEAMAYYNSREFAVMPGSGAEYAQTAVVSPEFFRVFAVEPKVGRFFTAEEVKPGSSRALIISHAYWQSHFGGDPRVLGQTVGMFGRTLSIVGVLPGKSTGSSCYSTTAKVMFNAGGKLSTDHRREVDLYLLVANVHAVYQRIKDRVQVVEDPHETFYGMREFVVRDINRFWVILGQPVQR